MPLLKKEQNSISTSLVQPIFHALISAKTQPPEHHVRDLSLTHNPNLPIVLSGKASYYKNKIRIFFVNFLTQVRY
jgi:hypothetical protein